MLKRKKEQVDNTELSEKIDKINTLLSKNRLVDLAEMIGSKKELIKKSFMSGLAKGIGFGIGVTVLTAIAIYFLERIVSLNIPVIGNYIADIVEIVESNSK